MLGEDLREFAQRLEGRLPVPSGGLDETDLGQEAGYPVGCPADSRPGHRALGQLACRVQVARVLLHQDAGHVFLQAGPRPRTQTVRLVQGNLGITHPRGADEEENQADVQV